MARIVEDSYIEDLLTWARGCAENYEVTMCRTLVEVAEDLKNMPEVVRCKDCYWWGTDGEERLGNYECRKWNFPMSSCRWHTAPDTYCSYGKRREGDDKR